MDTTDKRKIQFADKVDVQHLQFEQDYVLTAGNINEIKNVVNNLSDQMSGIPTFNDIFRYIKINVPQIKNQEKYSFQIQLSQNLTFKNSIIIDSNPSGLLSSSVSDVGIFYIYSGNSWTQYQNIVLSSSDSGKIIKTDIKDILDEHLFTSYPYFGRIRFKEFDTKQYSEYFGFSLSFVNVQDDKFLTEKETYSEFIISGDNFVHENQKHEYNLYGKNLSGQLEDLTNIATFSCLSSDYSYMENNFLITKPNMLADQIQLISATFNSDQVKRNAYLQVYIKPIKTLGLYLNCNNEINPGTKNQIEVLRKLSNNTIQNVTEKCDITVIPSSLCKIIQQEYPSTISTLLSADAYIEYQQFGIVQAKFPKQNPYFIAQSQFRLNSSVKQKRMEVEILDEYKQSPMVKNNSYFSLVNMGYINGTKYDKFQFKMMLKSSNGSENISNRVEITEIDSQYLKISTDLTNEKIIFELNEDMFSILKNNITILISVTDPNTGFSKKYYVIISPEEINLEKYSELIFELSNGNIMLINESNQYVIKGRKRINGEVVSELDITKDVNVELFTPNNEAQISKIKHIILTGEKIENDSYGYLKATYAYEDGSSITSYYQILFKKG